MAQLLLSSAQLSAVAEITHWYQKTVSDDDIRIITLLPSGAPHCEKPAVKQREGRLQCVSSQSQNPLRRCFLVVGSRVDLISKVIVFGSIL